ncbi:Uu.00g134130.m01.CDS01 [Anthostomella pinea]|uniref:Uu.00g134130.m01.CDS01 n=1 Tax=Anthostomella pinea TaxID=933095 RepID=A0AAI8YKT7_9PEZI|nr:Uu.00g134130.m01.CDS01 [Anthostomella pinea]
MTTQFHPPDISVLKDKVVVLTGGALGVGAAVVRLLHSAGAHVFFGDVLDAAGRALADELTESNTNTDNPSPSPPHTSTSPPKPKVVFIHTDVTNYQENLALFQKAHETCGRIDHAIANAGLGEQGKPSFFDAGLSLEDVAEEPVGAMRCLDVNLKGALYCARIASVYLRQGPVDRDGVFRGEGGEDGEDGGGGECGGEGGGGEQKGDRSLTLVSSVAGFREDPGPLINTGIRTNAICPWMTRTRLTTNIAPTWAAAGLPSNTPDDVAAVIAGVLASPKINGGALYVEGGRAWNVEEGILATRKLWLGAGEEGERLEEDLERGTRLIGGGEHWVENGSSQV